MLQIFGAIDSPYPAYADLQGGGLIAFLSNIIRLIMIAGGLFAFFNLIIAGFQYIASNGDSKNTSAAWSRIYMSLIGLVVIVSSFALAGIIGYVLFKDWTAILNPKIYGPGAAPAAPAGPEMSV